MRDSGFKKEPTASRYNRGVPTSVWLDDPYAPRPAGDGPARVDVAVLGGGITGVAAARFLRERGASVAVVDRGPLAVGATGRNAGFNSEPSGRRRNSGEVHS